MSKLNSWDNDKPKYNSYFHKVNEKSPMDNEYCKNCIYAGRVAIGSACCDYGLIMHKSRSLFTGVGEGCSVFVHRSSNIVLSSQDSTWQTLSKRHFEEHERRLLESLDD